MSINVGALVGDLTLTDNWTNVAERAAGSLDSLSNRFNAFTGRVGIFEQGLAQSGRTIAYVGDRLSLLAAPIIAAGVAATKMSVDFEQTMTKVANVTEIGNDALGSMKDAVLSMAPAVGQGPQALADALYSIGSVGLKGADALAVLENSAKASAVGLGEAKDVAKAVSAAMINYADDHLTAAHATQILFTAVKEGGAEADDFARTLGRVIATARNVGVSFEEVTASIATFTRLGVRGDEAVTALRGTMSLLLKPSAGARKELLELGTSIEQVRDKVRKDGLADALIELVKLTKGNDDALGKIIPNVRALAGVLGNTGAQADTYREILRKTKTETESFGEAFAAVGETGAFKFAAFWSKVQVLAIEIGDHLAPAFISILSAAQPLLGVVEKLIQGFGLLPAPIQTLVIGLTAVTLLSAPLLSFFGRLGEVVGVLLGPAGFSGLVKWLTSSATAWGVTTAAVEANTVATAANEVVQASAATATTASAASMGLSASAFYRSFRQAQEAAMEAWQVGSSNLLGFTKQIEASTSRISGLGQAVEDGASKFAPFAMGAGLATNSAGQLAAQLTGTTEAAAVMEGEVLGVASSVPLAFTAMAGTVGAVIAAVFVGGTVAVAAMTGQMDDLRTAVSRVPGFFSDLGSIIKETFLKNLGYAKDLVLEFAGALKSLDSKAGIGFFDDLKLVLRDQLDQWTTLTYLVHSFTKAANEAPMDKIIKSGFKPAFTPEVANKPINFATGNPVTDAQNALSTKGTEFFTIPQAQAIQGAQVTLGGLTGVVKDYTAALEAAKNELKNLDPETRKNIVSGIAMHQSTEQLVIGTHASAAAIDLLRTELTGTESAAKKHAKALKDVADQTADLTDVQKSYIETNLRAGVSVINIAEALDLTTDRVKAYKDDLKMYKEEFQEVMHSFASVGTQISNFIDKADFQEDLHFIKEQIRITGSDLDEFGKVYGEYTEKNLTVRMTAGQKVLHQIEVERDAAIEGAKNPIALAEVNKYYDTILAREKELQKLAKDIEKFQLLGDAFTKLGSEIGDNWAGKIVSGIGTISSAWADAIKMRDVYAHQEGGVATGGQKVGAVIGGAASVLGSTSSGGTLSRTIGGAAAGAAAGASIGMAFSGVSMGTSIAIGAAAGALVGWVRGMQASAKATDEANQGIMEMKAQLAGAYGSLDGAKRAALAFGFSLDGALNGKGVGGAKNLEAAILKLKTDTERLNTALDKYAISWTELGEAARAARVEEVARQLLADYKLLAVAGVEPTRAIEGMGTAFSELIVAAKTSGQKIPVALQPMLETLIRSGKLSEDAARALLGMSTDAVPAFADVQAAAERYGLKIDELGPKINQIRINDITTQIVADWDLLQRAGADTSVVLSGMRDSVQQVVSDALRLGLTVPEAMRPLLQAMVDAGFLTDQFGNQLHDLSGINFETPLSQKIDDLIGALRDLIDQMSKVGDAAEDMGRRVAGGIPTGGVAVPRDSAHAAIGGIIQYDSVGNIDNSPIGNLLRFKPRGTDTVPAMLTPGEAVLNQSQQDQLVANFQRASTGTDGPVIYDPEVHVHLYGATDKRELVELIGKTGQKQLDSRSWSIPSDVILPPGRRRS